MNFAEFFEAATGHEPYAFQAKARSIVKPLPQSVRKGDVAWPAYFTAKREIREEIATVARIDGAGIAGRVTLERPTECWRFSPPFRPEPVRGLVAPVGAASGVHRGSTVPTRPPRPVPVRSRRPRGWENKRRAWASAPWNESPALLMRILLVFPYLVYRLTTRYVCCQSNHAL